MVINPLARPGPQGESNVACSEQWAYMQGKNCAMGPQKCADYYACQFPAFIQDLQTRFAVILRVFNHTSQNDLHSFDTAPVK
jgi:hypothetical protein